MKSHQGLFEYTDRDNTNQLFCPFLSILKFLVVTSFSGRLDEKKLIQFFEFFLFLYILGVSAEPILLEK